MAEERLAIDHIAPIFCAAAKKTLDKATGKIVTYSHTIQKITKLSIRPDLGCFVQFAGDYNGLTAMNFSAAAAMELYRGYMITMGLPASDLAKEPTSSEVVDTIGEITNQVMGRAVRMVESKYDLSSKFGQPKALALNSAIALFPELTNAGVVVSGENDEVVTRRIVFKIDNVRFHMEISMESATFMPML